MKKTLFAVLVVVLSLCGCHAGTDKQTQEIKNAILRYNHLLSEGYIKMNMAPLLETAAPDHVQKVYYHMAALGEAKIRMESQLVDLKFLEFQFLSKYAAKARTREKWNYSHTRIGETLPVRKVVEGYIYQLSYLLVKDDSRWLVSSVSVSEDAK